VLNEPVNRQKAYGTLDARVSWETGDGRMELALFARNLTGTIYRVYSLDVSALSLAINILGERATYGGSVRFKY
jgi:outer membrane receptor protein involved in Fe transport